jgi:hypothetical protein
MELVVPEKSLPRVTTTFVVLVLLTIQKLPEFECSISPT